MTNWKPMCILLCALLVTACGASHFVSIDVRGTVRIPLQAKENILILPFTYENLSTSKDTYSQGAEDFNAELRKSLADGLADYADNELIAAETVTRLVEDAMADTFTQGEPVPWKAEKLLDHLAAHKDGFRYIIGGKITFRAADASRFQEFKEYSYRYHRYYNVNRWVKEKQFYLTVDYFIYDCSERVVVEEDRLKEENVVEGYQQQVYGFWTVAPLAIATIVDNFIPKERKAERYLIY